MDIRFLTAKDWDDLRGSHRSAYLFLLQRGLRNELTVLRLELQGRISHPGRQQWVERRVNELELVFAEDTARAIAAERQVAP